MQNTAAKVLMKINSRDHIIPILASLHWLPIKPRIQFKILLLTKLLMDKLKEAPAYLRELNVPKCRKTVLHSQSIGLLEVPSQLQLHEDSTSSEVY